MDVTRGLRGGRILLVPAQPTVGFGTERVRDTVVIWVCCQMLCGLPGQGQEVHLWQRQEVVSQWPLRVKNPVPFLANSQKQLEGWR